MTVKKLLGDDKITACVKQVCLLGVTCKVSNKQTLSGETFCFLGKSFLSIFKFCAVMSNLCIAEPPVNDHPKCKE